MGQFPIGSRSSRPLVADVLTRLEAVRAAHDEQLRTADVAQRFAWRCSSWRAALGARTVDPRDAQPGQRSQLLREGRELLTTRGQPVQPDPGFDLTATVMSLVVLRFP